MEQRIITAAIVLFGVPAAPHRLHPARREAARRSCPRSGRAGSGRGSGSRRRWRSLSSSSIYPTINTIVLSFMDKFSKNFVGLDNYLWFFGDPGTLEALRNSVLWVVFMTARRRRPRAAHRGPRRSRPLRAGRQDGDLPAPRDQLRGGGDHLEVHVPVPAAWRLRRRARSTPSSGCSGWVRSTGSASGRS